MLIRLRVHPSFNKEEILRRAPDHYEIWVREPAQGGRANAACLRLLGCELGLPPGRLRIVKGGRSPSKIVEIRGAFLLR